MTTLLATKASIKKAYIAALQATYPFYSEGSKPLAMAQDAADKALAGQMKLSGVSWSHALALHGLNDRTTLKALSELPA